MNETFEDALFEFVDTWDGDESDRDIIAALREAADELERKVNVAKSD